MHAVNVHRLTTCPLLPLTHRIHRASSCSPRFLIRRSETFSVSTHTRALFVSHRGPSGTANNRLSRHNLTMDYSDEPLHSNLLTVQSKEPFNAEPLASALVEFDQTPEELVYCRNHGPVREFDEDTYTLRVKGGVERTLELRLKDLKANFAKVEIVAALQVCLLMLWGVFAV